MSALDISVVGAGVGGLASAALLGQAGQKVDVYERADTFENVGAGIQISPNGMTVLRSLGLEQDILNAGLKATAIRLIDGISGRVVTEMNLGRDAPDLNWVFLHRPLLISILEQAARRAGAQVHFKRQFEAKEVSNWLNTDILIGADGVQSAVRELIILESNAFFTGQVAWRALIPETDLNPVVEVFMGPGQHLVSYPMKGSLRNIVAVEERDFWAEEGWSHKDDPDNLCAAFTNFCPRVRCWLGDVETTYLWGLFRHPIAQTWVKDKCVLVGDAAHPTLPFLAQGANMALEDAAMLSRLLMEKDLTSALFDYQSSRIPRVRKIIAASNGNARNYHLSNPLVRSSAHLALGLAGKLFPKQVLGRFDWLYRYDATKA